MNTSPYHAGRAVLVFALLFNLLSHDSEVNGEPLPKDWQALSMSAARLHYHEHVLSRKDRTVATEECVKLQGSADPAKSSVAKELVPLLKEVASLEVARLNSGMGQRDQAAARDQAIVELFLGATSYRAVMFERLYAATDFAVANDRLLLLEAWRSAVTTNLLLPCRKVVAYLFQGICPRKGINHRVRP